MVRCVLECHVNGNLGPRSLLQLLIARLLPFQQPIASPVPQQAVQQLEEARPLAVEEEGVEHCLSASRVRC